MCEGKNIYKKKKKVIVEFLFAENEFVSVSRVTSSSLLGLQCKQDCILCFHCLHFPGNKVLSYSHDCFIALVSVVPDWNATVLLPTYFFFPRSVVQYVISYDLLVNIDFFFLLHLVNLGPEYQKIMGFRFFNL